MMLYSDLIEEVKRMAIRSQGGTEFDGEIKAGINESLFRIARDTNWTKLRRHETFDTVTKYDTGTGAVTVTHDSKNVTVTGATLITDGIRIGRRVTLGGSNLRYTIKTITGETTFTVDYAYDGTSSAVQSYIIWPQEEYVLPAQCDKVAFLYHERFNYPYVMKYIPNLEFFQSSTILFYQTVPIYYKMWEENMALQQPLQGSVVSVSSSSASDTAVVVSVFGTVSGYPDSEQITVTGTTPVNGSKVFTYIDRVSKASSSTGRITCTTNTAAVTVAVIPAGDATGGIFYKKVLLWPLPSAVFPMHVMYYKQPYRLVNDNDIHELGQEFDHAIILLTTAKIRYQNNQKEGDRFMAMYTDELKSLRKMNGDKLDFLNVLKRPEDSRFLGEGIHPQVLFRQLGGNFGPSSFR
jgi:hypothetical protein